MRKIESRGSPNGNPQGSREAGTSRETPCPAGLSERSIPVGTTFDEFRRLLELERDKRDLTKALDKLLVDMIAGLRPTQRRS